MAIYWLTFSDIKPCLERLTNHKKISKVLNIKTEDDVHQLVGLIIQKSQEWELEVKKLLGTLNVDKNSLIVKGIGDIIAHVCNKGLFNEEEARTLRDVVKLRNYIIHHFYLEYKHTDLYSLNICNEVLNKIYFIISEAIVSIKNRKF